MKKLYEALEKIPGIQVYGNSKECRGPVMSLNFKGLTASDAAYILESGYGITVRAGLHCSPLIHEAMGTQKNGTIRISISYFTKEKDIQEFLLKLKSLGGFVYLDMLKQPFFKIENNYYMIKGIEGNDYFRIAVHGKHEDELAKLEAFILNCVKE